MSKISEILGGEGISLEVFPPKTRQGEERLLSALSDLADLRAKFVSVTSGANGTEQDAETLSVVRLVMNARRPVMPHLTCIGRTEEDLVATLRAYRDAGVENILALRGDLKPGIESRLYALDLIRLARECFGTEICIGGSAYLEPHPESLGRERDFQYLREKQDTGMSFAVTQLFFDNSLLYDFLDDCSRYGVTVPIIPGIFTVTDDVWIRDFSRTHRVTIPPKLLAGLERHTGDPESIAKVGIEHACSQVRDLKDHGIRHLHLYTMNRSHVARKVWEAFTDS